MGRKGVSKRKTKSSPASSGAAKGSTSSVMKVFEKGSVGATSDTPKTDPGAKSKAKPDAGKATKK